MSITLLRPRRRALLILVYGASFALVIVTALALDIVVGQHVSSTAVESTVAADRSLVRSFAGRTLTASDLAPAGPGADRSAIVRADLAALVNHGDGILQLKIHSVSGSILFSDRAVLEGTTRVDVSLQQAIAGGQSVANLETADESDSATVGAPEGSKLIEEYLPIVDGGGRVQAVFEIYRDAGPVLAAADASQRDVLIVTSVAAIVLTILLHLIFRAAQTRLSRQTDELVEAQRRDALTGMLNHGTAVGLLAAQIEDARADGRAVGVALAFGCLRSACHRSHCE